MPACTSLGRVSPRRRKVIAMSTLSPVGRYGRRAAAGATLRTALVLLVGLGALVAAGFGWCWLGERQHRRHADAVDVAELVDEPVLYAARLRPRPHSVRRSASPLTSKSPSALPEAQDHHRQRLQLHEHAAAWPARPPTLLLRPRLHDRHRRQRLRAQAGRWASPRSATAPRASSRRIVVAANVARREARAGQAQDHGRRPRRRAQVQAPRDDCSGEGSAEPLRDSRRPAADTMS